VRIRECAIVLQGFREGRCFLEREERVTEVRPLPAVELRQPLVRAMWIST
jgi:hypothetical protein